MVKLVSFTAAMIAAAALSNTDSSVAGSLSSHHGGDFRDDSSAGSDERFDFSRDRDWEPHHSGHHGHLGHHHRPTGSASFDGPPPPDAGNGSSTGLPHGDPGRGPKHGENQKVFEDHHHSSRNNSRGDDGKPHGGHHAHSHHPTGSGSLDTSFSGSGKNVGLPQGKPNHGPKHDADSNNTRLLAENEEVLL